MRYCAKVVPPVPTLSSPCHRLAKSGFPAVLGQLGVMLLPGTVMTTIDMNIPWLVTIFLVLLLWPSEEEEVAAVFNLFLLFWPISSGMVYSKRKTSVPVSRRQENIFGRKVESGSTRVGTADKWGQFLHHLCAVSTKISICILEGTFPHQLCFGGSNAFFKPH